MQRAALIVAIVLLLASGATASTGGLDLRFHPPAQLGPTLNATGGQWIFLVFSNQTPAAGAVRFDAPTTGQQFNEVQTYHDLSPVSAGPIGAPAPGVPKDYTPFQADLNFGQGPGSIYIEAAEISWTTVGQDAALDHLPAFGCLTAASQTQQEEHSARYDQLCKTEAVGMTMPTSPTFTLHATGVKTVEWHDAALTCHAPSDSECPTGGKREEQRTDVGTGYVIRRQLTFERVSAGNGTLDASGSAALLVVGGKTLGVAVAGHARLPLASAPPACQGCLAPDGQTFLADGDFTLRGVALQSDGTLSGRIEGDLANVRFDETSIDPAAIGLGAVVAAGVAAAVGLSFLLKPLAGSLFTRVQPGEVLRNRNRRAIFDYIGQNPGAGFNELQRALDVGKETVSYHVRVLLNAGKITQQSHGNTRRFFPAGFDAGQRTRTVLLRTKALDDLYALVERHPNLAQGEIMDLAAKEMGWSRSTTQHRLGRLVKAGLVATQREGRSLLHSAQSADSFRLTPVPLAATQST